MYLNCSLWDEPGVHLLPTINFLFITYIKSNSLKDAPSDAYDENCIKTALDDAGVQYTKEQLHDVVIDIINGLSVKNEYMGYDQISYPDYKQIEIDKLKSQIKNLEHKRNLIEDFTLSSNGLTQETHYVNIDNDGITEIRSKY
jgi:hypothetical protein